MSASPRAKDVIVATAVEMFAEEGYDQVDIDALVKRARTSRGLILYHFGNKAGILYEIFLRNYPKIEACICPVPYPENPSEHLTLLITNWGKSLGDIERFWQMYWPLKYRKEIIGLANQSGLTACFDRHFEQLISIYQDLQHPHPSHAARAFDAFRNGLSEAYLAHPQTYPLSAMLEIWEAKFCL